MTTVDVSVQQGSVVATLPNAFTYTVPLKVITGDSNGVIAIRDPDTLAVESSLDVGGAIADIKFHDGFIYAVFDSKLQKIAPADLSTVAQTSTGFVAPLYIDPVGNIYVQVTSDDLVQFDTTLTETGRNASETNAIRGIGGDLAAVFHGGFNDVLRRSAHGSLATNSHTVSGDSTDIEDIIVSSDGFVLVGDRTTTLRKYTADTLTADGTVTISNWGSTMAASPDGHVFVARGGSSSPSSKVRVSDMTVAGTNADFWGANSLVVADNGFMYGAVNSQAKLVKYTIDPFDSVSDVPLSTGVVTVNRNVPKDVLGL